MNKLTQHVRLVPLLFVLFAIMARVLPHPANFAPITALALFGGAHFAKKETFLLPILAMFLSDLVIGFYGTEMIFVYGSFLMISAIGWQLRRRASLKNVALATLVSSVLFYIVTNFGVWATTTMYSKDLIGLFNSYLAGLPFFRNTFLSDSFYSGVFFGGFALLKKVAQRTLRPQYFQIAF